MKKYTSLMLLAGLVLLNACQAANIPAQNNTPTQAAPVFPRTASQTPQQPRSTIAQATLGADQKIVQLSVAALAKSLQIKVDQVQVLKITPVIWRDASLGCPKPGIDYIQVETPGYRVSLQAEGKQYDYHTDQTSRVLSCDSLK